MPDTVRDYVSSCPSCQSNKAQSDLPGGLLKPLEIPERAWQAVSLDLMVDLPLTPQTKFNAIAVFVDRLTKLFHAAPTRKDVDKRAWLN